MTRTAPADPRPIIPPAPTDLPAASRAPAVAVRARGLRKSYGSGPATVRALDGVDLDVAAGEFTAVMGPSGSGKSTLLHCLAGLDSVTEGSVSYGRRAGQARTRPGGGPATDREDDRDWIEITALSDAALTRVRRDRVGFVFQSFNLLPMLTAEQNILLPLDLAGRRADRTWVDSLVSVLGLGDRLRHRPAELSGGQQQRVACARALVTRPTVVFADEPTGNLDSRSTAEVLGFLRRSVRELGQTVVMITHDPNAAAYADRVVLVADGRLVGDLTDPSPAAVLDSLVSLGEHV